MRAIEKLTPNSLELFAFEKDRPTDARLHAEILATGDHQKVKVIGRSIAKRLGLTEEELDRLYSRE